MDRDVSGIPLNRLRHIYNCFSVSVFLIKFLELWIFFYCSVKSHGESLGAERNKFGYLITQGIRETESTSDITHRSASHHGAEGSNLSNVIVTIFLTRIFDQFITPVISDIQ